MSFIPKWFEDSLQIIILLSLRLLSFHHLNLRGSQLTELTEEHFAVDASISSHSNVTNLSTLLIVFNMLLTIKKMLLHWCFVYYYTDIV